jgi:hypothetical protein
MERTGRDIGKVLQRYLFRLTTDIKKLQYRLINYRILFPLPFQMTAFVKLWRYSCPPSPLAFFHSFRGEGMSIKFHFKGE